MRDLAAVLLESSLTHSEDEDTYILNLPPPLIDQLKPALLQMLARGGNRILNLVSRVATVLMDVEGWDELLQAVFDLCASSAPAQCEKGLYLFGGLGSYLAEQEGEIQQRILMMMPEIFQRALNAGTGFGNLRVTAMEALSAYLILVKVRVNGGGESC